jgi:hypothetical protein
MTISCPKCGKPLRPGVKFCGNCGSPVQAGPQAQTDAATILCPHCNSPVRSGAKFCNVCGKALDQVPQPAAPPAGGARPAGAPPVMPPPAVASQEGRPAEARPVAPARRRRSGWLWALVGLLVIVCLLAGGGGFLYFRNPAGLFRKATTSATALPATTQVILATTTEAPTATIELQPTDTTAPLPLPTTSVPEETVPPVQETPVVTVTSTITSAEPTQEPVTLLFDDFTDSLAFNWNTWGNPRPLIKPGPQSSWLDLVAEDSGAAGVTSKREKAIPNASGVVIEFGAQLNERFPQYVLMFDWDPMSYDRGPDNRDPGAIHLEIRRNKMQFSTPRTASGCESELAGTVSHTFTLRIVEGQGVDLYIDGDGLPVCRIANMGQEVVAGRISFTGLGWVTRVLVTGPAK